MSKIVKYAKLQTAYFSQGLGDLGTVFPPTNKTLSNLAMNMTSDGLSIKFMFNFGEHELMIPYANIVGMTVVPEKKTK